jgi:hypothetical protein
VPLFRKFGIHLYHGRGNAIRPYNNGIIYLNPVNPDSKPSGKGKYYIKTCLGEDARHRISTIGLRKNIMSIRHYLRKLA